LICWRYLRRRRRRRRRHPPAAWSTRETVSVCSEALCAAVRGWKSSRWLALAKPLLTCCWVLGGHHHPWAPWSSH
jgi:hypothetical protein